VLATRSDVVRIPTGSFVHEILGRPAVTSSYEKPVANVANGLDPLWAQFPPEMTEINVSDVRIRFPLVGPNVLEQVVTRDRRWVRTHECFQHVSLSGSEFDDFAVNNTAT